MSQRRVSNGHDFLYQDGFVSSTPASQCSFTLETCNSGGVESPPYSVRIKRLGGRLLGLKITNSIGKYFAGCLCYNS